MIQDRSPGRRGKGARLAGVSGPIRNTLPDQAGQRPVIRDKAAVLRQWNQVCEAWDNDFAAYLRYIQFN